MRKFKWGKYGRRLIISVLKNKMEEFDKKNYAKVHSIETMGTVDGPGIRFVLFLQGCMLKCKYCHNRDTWSLGKGTIMSADELAKKVARYKNFLLPCGGGFTATGGEPLLQVKFLITLFEKLKQEGIPTAIDTSGMVTITDDVKEVLALTDLVLLDIKHIDNDKCKELVGYSNKLELEFARYLSDNNIPMWIRQVIVPGITDDDEDLIKLKDFLATLKGVQKVELLPYHSMGKYKWQNLGYQYVLDDVPDATKEDIDRAKRILELT